MTGERPSAVTAMLAVVLATVTGVFFTIGVIGDVGDLSMRTHPAMTPVSLVLDATCAVVSLFGAILLGLRKPVGRILVVSGAGLAMLDLVVLSVVSLARGMDFGVLAGSFAACLIPVFTVVAALRPATRDWLAPLDR
jgi:hypothetical protein